VDAYIEAGQWPVTLFPRGYAELARHHALLWSLLYRVTNAVRPRTGISRFVHGGLRRVMQAERPSVVVSTLPVVNDVLVQVAHAAGVRMEVVLTDWHSVHRFWVAPGVDYYTAPTDTARDDCIRFGAPAERVESVGIPVRRRFLEVARTSRESLRQRFIPLGLDPRRFTLLAMVGAEGSPRAVRNIARLLQLDLDAQTIVVCGRADDLRRSIERMPHRMPVRALGFVEDIPELMRSVDLLVSKAGGLTLAEAFCSRVPIVVHDVLPGQEEGNLAYALQHGAVVYAPTPDALADLVSRLSRDAVARTGLAERGSQLARPDAAERIARGVLARLAR
jgi:processive 1,2-diacylglycerol beta-glucosyltransferase